MANYKECHTYPKNYNDEYVVSYRRHPHSTRSGEQASFKEKLFYRASEDGNLWQQHAVDKTKRRSWQALIVFDLEGKREREIMEDADFVEENALVSGYSDITLTN
jgi:hypothetical protein